MNMKGHPEEHMSNLNLNDPSLESAADDGFYVAPVAAKAGVDGHSAEILLQFLLTSDTFQPHQLTVIVRVPKCGNEDISVNQNDKIILQENLQEKLTLSLSSLEKTLVKILFISMYVQYFDYFLNLIPVLDRHVLLVGDVLVLQIVSVVKDRGTIDCYGIIVAVMR